MKVPISWLKEFIPFSHSPQELADLLTLAGLEVEGIESTALKFTGVVVGKVISVEKHPNADRLRVAIVSDGAEQFQVVCGAPNCRAGIKTAFAKIGATLTDAENKVHKIKKGKMRDVESHGMLCSAQELLLSDSHEGIMELPEEAIEGTALETLYGDAVLEVSLTPNLGHCFSLLGIARELSALIQTPYLLPAIEVNEGSKKIEDALRVQLIDKRQCARFACRLIEGITVKESPDWLKKKLEACGVRSINNVVDVGNLVMLELGQPLHLFDYDTIEGKQLTITSETSYDRLETLDEIERLIPPQALLISDQNKPLSFAGVMGGKNSGVTEKTVNVLIEAAYFPPQTVRKTCKLIGLKTDSSQRFEKGIDPNGVITALNRAVCLLQEIAGGEIRQGIIDETAHLFERKKIACRVERVNALLGTSLSLREMADIFQRLECEILSESAHQLNLAVPTYRNDLTAEIDLIEEIARIYGYNNIPKSTPKFGSSLLPHAPIYLLEKNVRTRLKAEGLQEFLTCDLISPTQAEMALENSLGQEALIHVLQPSSIEQSVLRTSLLPGLLQVVKYNKDHFNDTIFGFEVGRIHLKEKENFKEYSCAGIVLSGKSTPYHFDPKPKEVDFFDLKGIIENLLQGLNISGATFSVSHLHNFHPGRQAHIYVENVRIGALGEIHPAHVAKIDIGQRVYYAELNLHELFPLIRKQTAIKEPSPYPGSERDWTVTLKDDVSIDHFLDAVKKTSSRLLESVYLLDLYKSEQIGKDRKNATFRFFYRDPNKTVAFETVDKEHARLTTAVVEKLKDSLI